MLQWVREMQSLARRSPRPYATLDEAIARMREANPHLTAEQARHLTENGVIRHVAKGDVVVIPAGTPHWYKDVDGSVTYLEVRFDVELK